MGIQVEKQLLITEWFSRAVAAGLIPEWESVIAYWSGDYANVYNDDTDDFIITTLEVEEFDQIKLRSNGKDLYELEWRKPTEEDIGKMCWFANGNSYRMPEIDAAHTLRRIDDEDDAIFYYASGSDYSHCYCLLADHNQLAPTEQDFKRIYGDQQ